MRGYLRTVALFLVFTILMSLVGWYSAGLWGASPIASLLVFLVLAGGLNFVMYFYSSKFVLRSMGARLVTPEEAPRLHRIVERVALKAGIPKPQVAISLTSSPNAFATGRSPKHAVVCATDGILRLLDDDELEGVLAHEVSHVKNRDTLIMTIAATFAAVISFASRMVIFSRNRDMNPLVAILLMVTAPIAAILIQLAISRSREFAADATGARTIGRPQSLARALQKLEAGVAARPLANGNPAHASLYIVHPFRGGGFGRLFSTHPPTAERVRRLEALVF